MPFPLPGAGAPPMPPMPPRQGDAPPVGAPPGSLQGPNPDAAGLDPQMMPLVLALLQNPQTRTQIMAMLQHLMQGGDVTDLLQPRAPGNALPSVPPHASPPGAPVPQAAPPQMGRFTQALLNMRGR